MPQPRFAGPMPWVIAIMVALTVIAAAAGLALRNTARAAAAELSGGVTVQIVEANPDERSRQTNLALAALAAVPGVSSVREVPQDELDRLIAPWLGAEGEQAAADANDPAAAIPVPALIDARLTGPATAPRLATVRATLHRVAPSARIDAQASWLRPVFGAIASLQWFALTLIVLLAGALAAAALLAARTALGNNRDTIEIVHLLGGTDAQIARIFQRSIGFDAAGGGALGLAAGLAAVLILGRRFAGLEAGLVGAGALGWSDWLVLALVPLAGVGLAMLTARLSVLRALRKML
ncbi:MAG: cell division protein [Novosphingobium sp.]|nr:cell division protein [Novosphingobium sp.]